MLKFSLGLRITNSRRENMRSELHRGLAVDRLLTAGLARALHAAHPGFAVVRDPAWLAVDAPDGHRESTGLDVVVRANPFPAGAAEQAVCVAGLVAPRPDLPDGRSQLARLVHGLAEATGRPPAEVGEEWFARYAEQVVAPVLWLYATYGLGLRRTSRTTLVVLDADGRPARRPLPRQPGLLLLPRPQRGAVRLGARHRPGPGDVRGGRGHRRATGLLRRHQQPPRPGRRARLAGLADEEALLRRADAFLAGLAAEHGDRLRSPRCCGTSRCCAARRTC